MDIGEIEKVWEIEPRPAEKPLTVPEPGPERAPERHPEPVPTGRGAVRRRQGE
jgi:hypothetical protein